MRLSILAGMGLVGFVVGGWLVGRDENDEAIAKDFKKFEGTWALVSAVKDGKDLSEEEVSKTKIRLYGNTFLFPDASGVGTSPKGITKLNPNKNPKWIDATPDSEDGQGKASLGIYEFGGEGYKVCFAPPGKDRPTAFESKPGSENNLQYWKLFGADAKSKLDKKAIQGKHMMVRGEEKGEALSEEAVKVSNITVKGDIHNVKAGETIIIGSHTLLATKTPAEIDSHDSEGPFKGKSMKGIYKIDEEGWTVCFAPPGKDRPKEFTTKSGTGLLLHVWKKID